jgi:hypothetical protein
VKGDMRMNILNDILEKEGDNRGSVYLYCLEDSWKAFGYSSGIAPLLTGVVIVIAGALFICLYFIRGLKS